MCQQLAPLRHAELYVECRLSWVKRKQRGHCKIVAFDPQAVMSAASGRNSLWLGEAEKRTFEGLSWADDSPCSPRQASCGARWISLGRVH
jgi:hypothetical protein